MLNKIHSFKYGRKPVSTGNVVKKSKNHLVVRAKTAASALHLERANLDLELLELLLNLGVLLSHLFVLGFPLVPLSLEGLNLAFEVAGLDVGDTQPV